MFREPHVSLQHVIPVHQGEAGHFDPPADPMFFGGIEIFSLGLPKEHRKQASGGARVAVPEPRAPSSRSGGRHHLVIVGDIIPLRWATSALASQSTISRLENAPSKTEAARLSAALLDKLGTTVKPGKLEDMGWCLRSRLATSAKFIADEAKVGQGDPSGQHQAGMSANGRTGSNHWDLV